jgi:excisionase family DNA binding protein
MTEAPLMTIEEISEFLNLNPIVVRRKIQAGEIEAYQLGKVYRISRDQLKNYLESQKVDVTKGDAAC